MTIDGLILLLTQAREELGGDALVAACWDMGISNLDHHAEHNGALIFDVEDYNSARHDHRIKFYYHPFKDAIRATQDDGDEEE